MQFRFWIFGSWFCEMWECIYKLLVLRMEIFSIEIACWKVVWNHKDMEWYGKDRQMIHFQVLSYMGLRYTILHGKMWKEWFSSLLLISSSLINWNPSGWYEHPNQHHYDISWKLSTGGSLIDILLMIYISPAFSLRIAAFRYLDSIN